MCKLMTITGSLKRDEVLTALKVTAQLFAKSQSDGFGFVAWGADGCAWGRYLKPENFSGWRGLRRVPDWLAGNTSEHGELPSKTTCLMMHGRTSTNHVTLHNVHPFRTGKHFLTHNGVLHWRGKHGEEPQAKHHCDSEQFALWLEKNDPALAHLAWGGYGAVFRLNSESGVVTLLKCGQASLHAAKRQLGVGWILGSSASDVMHVALQSRIPVQTKALEVPQRLVPFRRSGAMLDGSHWQGFASERWSHDMYRSLPERPYHATQRVMALDTTKEAFPDWDPEADAFRPHEGFPVS